MTHAIDEFNENPGYYFNNEIKDIYFDSVDGKEWYCNAGGNHRTIVGKFALAMANEKLKISPILQNVLLTEYIIDWDSFHLYSDLIKVIKLENLKLYITIYNEFEKSHTTDSIKKGKIEFIVRDYTFSRAYTGRFSPINFQKYAFEVIKSKGKLNIFKRLYHFLKSPL